jgi:hypothetical protein
MKKIKTLLGGREDVENTFYSWEESVYMLTLYTC